MTPTVVAFWATGLSLVGLVLLALSDPKRARLNRRSQWLGRGARRTVSALVCLPGLILLAQGFYAAVLLWLGALLLGGWGLAWLLAWRDAASESFVASSTSRLCGLKTAKKK